MFKYLFGAVTFVSHLALANSSVIVDVRDCEGNLVPDARVTVHLGKSVKEFSASKGTARVQFECSEDVAILKFRSAGYVDEVVKLPCKSAKGRVTAILSIGSYTDQGLPKVKLSGHVRRNSDLSQTWVKIVGVFSNETVLAPVQSDGSYALEFGSCGPVVGLSIQNGIVVETKSMPVVRSGSVLNW